MGAHQPAHGLGAFDVISTVGGKRGAPRPDVPEAPGLRAIAQGFPLVAADDMETLERAAFLFDALYASLQARLRP